MEIYFLIIDHAIFLLAVYFVLYKGSLSIVYVPFLYFAYKTLELSNYILFMQLLFFLLLVYYVVTNFSFFRRNIFSVLIVFYYTFLLLFTEHIRELKWEVLYVLWLFLIIPLAAEILSRFKRETVFKELSQSAFLIMSLFVFNTFLSTLLGYYPRDHYGFEGGVSFGNISIDVYSVFPLTIFLILRRGIRDNNMVFLTLYLVSIFLVMLTLRRTVMALSVVASIMVFVELLNIKQLKAFFLYGVIICSVGAVIFYYSGFGDQLNERIERRNLQERELAGELRFMEFGLVYKDLFVFYDYSPWFGFGLFETSGNYGKGIFGPRPLHSDLTYIVHSSGILGLLLYVGILIVGFSNAWKNIKTKEDFVLFLFVLMYTTVFLVLGSSRNFLSPIVLYCMLSLLYTKTNNQSTRFPTYSSGVKRPKVYTLS